MRALAIGKLKKIAAKWLGDESKHAEAREFAEKLFIDCHAGKGSIAATIRREFQKCTNLQGFKVETRVADMCCV